MPWSNQSGGGWKGGGPWGQGPTGGPGGGQPDLEDQLKRSQDRLKQVIPGGGPPAGVIVLLAALVVAAIGFFGFTFRVNPEEQGIVLRFGKFVRQEAEGLHFRLPYPIEEVRKPQVGRQQQTDIGLRAFSSGRGTVSRDMPEGNLMLTGDDNIVDVEFSVVWRIGNAVKYLFDIQNPETTVREVAESAMREVVGKKDIQPLLTEGRLEVEQAVRKLMQDILDRYSDGMVIVDYVRLQKVAPPQQVIDAFLDVQAARNDKDKFQNEASAYANRVVPQAEGEAQRIREAAIGYKDQVIAEAIGQTARFLKILAEYEKAPEVTRQRMFLETMERVLGGSDKIILDSKTGSGPVPILPLDQLKRSGDR
jgi:membrane protease subunit HflK